MFLKRRVIEKAQGDREGAYTLLEDLLELDLRSRRSLRLS